MLTHDLYEKVKSIPEHKKREIFCIIEDVMSEIKRKHPGYYAPIEKKFSSLIEEDCIDQYAARHFVDNLKNEDGTIGAHWDSANVKRIMEEYPKLQEFSLWSVYVAINMIYSDYYMPKFDTKTYAELAYKFLCDKDARADKLKWYMEEVKA